MKKILIAAAAALALSGAAACTPVDPGAGFTQGTTVDEKAMFALEASYNVAGNAYLAAVDSGLLTGVRKDTARERLQLAYGFLGHARTAYQLGDAAAFRTHSAATRAAIQQAEALLPTQE